MTGIPFANLLEPGTGILGAGTGSPGVQRVTRHLSELREAFRDQAAVERLLAEGDPLLYEVYNVPVPEDPGELQHCTSVIQPGAVGEEFFMTAGHFHARLATAEVYLCLRGRGVLLMQDRAGEVVAVLELFPGAVSYIPPEWAHRSVNTGPEPLVLFCVYPGDAGHDYGTLREKGFAKLVLRDGGSYRLADNPAYR
ncbi:MAG: glucose-6-phosphate isomerase family protein [Bacillota bacterium]|nr:glucose-6-phosphate isomerase family protein [Bacillota bacterium]